MDANTWKDGGYYRYVLGLGFFIFVLFFVFRFSFFFCGNPPPAKVCMVAFAWESMTGGVTGQIWNCFHALSWVILLQLKKKKKRSN